MLDALDWLSVKQRVYATTLSFIFKLKYGLIPLYLMEMVKLKGNVHQYNTRGRSDFHVTNKKSGTERKSLFHDGLLLFNSLPMDIKNERNGSVFEKKLRGIARDLVRI